MAVRSGSLLRNSPKKLQLSQRNYTEDEVRSTVTSVISSGNKVSETINSLFSTCSSDSTEPQRRVIFETCIKALNTGAGERLQTQVAKDIIGKLLLKVDKLEGETLVTLAEQLIKGVKEGHHHALELFPQLLSVISSKKTIQYRKENGVRGEMDGAMQKGHLLNSLCGCRWDPECVQHIAHMCQEISMNSEELQFLIEKILRVMRSMKVTELPPLVYQLLVLSLKGHRGTVLAGVRTLFNQINEEVLRGSTEEEEDSVVSVKSSKKELLQTEGTVILHITCALKQDPELRKVFIKALKASQSCLSPDTLSLFNLALVLSLARIHIFEDVVFSFMKEVVLKSFKEQERIETSKWMQEMYQDTPSVESLLLEIVDHSTSGWDHVVEGLFIMGLQLMETFGHKTATTSSSSGPQCKASCLGSKILYHTFKVHVMVRQELVTQLVNRILTNASTFAGHYTELLSSLVEHYHQAALESLPKLKEAFSSLSLLPSQPALDLLHAVLPLVQFNVSLRDTLLLVLRKSLFSRQMEARKIAVAAYLMLLRKFKVLDTLDVDSQSTVSSMSGSQVLVEIHAGGSSVPTGNAALCLEILGILRRALTKQYDVKLSLYEGLCGVFYSNSKLAEPIMDLLLGQFDLYYEPSQDTLPPLKLSTCLSIGDGDTSLLEPLDVLLQAMQLCVFKYCEWQDKAEEQLEEVDQAIETPEVIESAKGVLSSLVDRMVKSEPEDFELDKSSDFTTGSSVGHKNRVLARLVMSTYEALLEFTFTIGEFSQASTEQTLKLFQGYKRVSDILQDKGGAQGGGASGKKMGGASTAVKSNLTLQFVVKLLQALFIDSSPNHQQPLKVLRDSQAFPKYVVNSAVQKIHQIHEKGTCEGAFADFRPDKLFGFCCDLGRILFKRVEGSASHVSTSKKDKGKSIPVLCLEGFCELLTIVVTRYHDNETGGSSRTVSMSLEGYLTAINPSISASASLEERIHYFIRQLQRLISGVLDANVKDWSLKEVVLMVNMIAMLAGQLDADSAELSAVFEWATSQCKDQNINDVQLTKAFVSLLLTLNSRLKGSLKMLVKFSQDAHYHLGDIDEDIEIECIPNYGIVNRHTTPSGVLALLYLHFDLVLVDADWLIGRLKTGLVTDPVEERVFEREASPVSPNAKEQCSSLCTRLCAVVSGLNELVQTLLAHGSNTSGLLKLVTKFFTIMGNLTKYCLLAFQRTSYIDPNFKSLVDIIGKDLSQQVYLFLNYVQCQQVQPGSGDGAEGSSKKGKGKGRGKGKSAADGGKVRQETRSFPSLIFAIEQFEKLLIQLGKKTKENLMGSFKRSSARDYRINYDTLNNLLHEEEGQGEEEEEEIGEGGASGECEDGGAGEIETCEDRPPLAKRRRKN